MFAKLATVIVVLGAMFGALLVNRQERIDTAAEISRIHFELERNDRERIRREADVAGRLTPAEIRELVVRLEKDAAVRAASALKPIPFREDPSSATDDALGTPEELSGERSGEFRKLVKEPARRAEGLGG